MKISSKSILSPCRGRDAPISLSSSLSRRLRTNGSLRGGQSPMFPTGSKKRGCTLENPDEPSSPKVTCIGQVRVKTKKQGKRMRTLSKRRGGGEVSFRRVEQSRERLNPNQTQNQQECLPHRNQRWVHLPLTICEALSCLFPCRSSCFSTSSGREKEEKATAGSSEGNGQSSCGAVFARWSVALQDGERVKGREKIELVVGGEEEKTETRERILRRHVDMVEKIEIEDEKWEVRDCCVVEEEEEEARVSICIPPKNALLLMRCRSDPMRMSALTNRLWESPVDDDLEEEGEDGEEGREDAEGGDTRLTEVEMSENLASTEDNEEEQENPEAEVHHVVMEVQEDEEKENPEEKLEIINEELQEEDEEKQEPVVQEVNLAAEAEKMENEEEETPKLIQEREEEEVEVETEALEEAEEKSTQEKETKEWPLTLKEEEETVTQDRSESEGREGGNHGKVERESEVKKKKKKPERRSSSTVLPDCLLLMMREPKLSMEVSEETWVCTTDFFRWLPERPVNTKDGGGDPKKRNSIDSTQQNPAHDDQSPQQQLRPRSSCSFPAPAAMSMATMIEQKLANAVAHEPFVLTRCKSEPMRTAAAKLAPETCFWKNRKLEPHRRVGAAGVGF